MFACARPCRTASAVSTFSEASLTSSRAEVVGVFVKAGRQLLEVVAQADIHMALSPSLTMDIRLRYDFEQLPAGFDKDANNFSPRVGLAFGPTPRWVLRAGYGTFYDREILGSLNRVIAQNGVTGFEQVANRQLAANLFQAAGGGSLTAPAGIAPSIFRPVPHLATPYSRQVSLGAEYLLAPDLTASVNYMFVQGVNLPRTLNSNLLPPVVLT